MSNDAIGLAFSIVLFIIAAINAYYIWFRDGARKSQQRLLKDYDENAPGSVSKYDKIVTHPFMFKAGSILLLVGFMIAILLTLKSLYFK